MDNTGTSVCPNAGSHISAGTCACSRARAVATAGATTGPCATAGRRHRSTTRVRAASRTYARATRGGRHAGAPARIAAARASDERIKRHASNAARRAVGHREARAAPQRDDELVRAVRGAERGLRDLLLGQAQGVFVPTVDVRDPSAGRRQIDKTMMDIAFRCAYAGPGYRQGRGGHLAPHCRAGLPRGTEPGPSPPFCTALTLHCDSKSTHTASPSVEVGSGASHCESWKWGSQRARAAV